MSDNPTPWTQRMSPNVAGRNMVRNVCWQIYSYHRPRHGPALQIGRMDIPPELGAKYNDV